MIDVFNWSRFAKLERSVRILVGSGEWLQLMTQLIELMFIEIFIGGRRFWALLCVFSASTMVPMVRLS